MLVERIGAERAPAELIEIMARSHRHELTDAWIEAWQRGPHWQQALREGAAMLPADRRADLATAVRKVAAEHGQDPDATGFAAADAARAERS